MSSEKLIVTDNPLTLVIDRIGLGLYQYKVAFILGIGSIALGANFAIMTMLPFILQYT